MCGRFAQSYEPAYLAQQLESGGLGVDDLRDLGDHHPSYNVAPQTFQAVYRSVRDGGAQDETTTTHRDAATMTDRPRRVLQGMKWGLIPFWTKRPPDSTLKTINCRDDSLIEGKAMWNAVKTRKRCIVPVEGYYEWLKKGPKEKVPHFTRRKDGKVMLLGGLYDSVRYEEPAGVTPLYTFTIVTTAASPQLAWLHDRMPLIFDNDDDKAIRKWLDDDTWSQDLVDMLHPYSGELECYAVRKEVGKVGTSSPDFIVPVDSKENRSNIANFFVRSAGKVGVGAAVKAEIKEEQTDRTESDDNTTTENNAPMPGKVRGRAHKEMVEEADLPFEFVPSHLETRPLETMDVWTYRCGRRSMTDVVAFCSREMRKLPEAKGLHHLKRLRAVRPDPVKLERDDSFVKIEHTDAPIELANSNSNDTPEDNGELANSNSNGPPEDDAIEGQLDIILCQCHVLDRDDLTERLRAAGITHGTLGVASVSKYPALSQNQYEHWKTLWPLSFRMPASRMVKMSRPELERCEVMMERCLEYAKEAADGDLPVAAIAWDPTGEGREIARALDRRHSTGHPLKHVVMELVSAVAANEVVRRIEEPDSPTHYLCTGLTVFLSHEPCTMCAMALLHARVDRVFFARSSARGGFATDYGIHWRKELNHRYSVFGGWMREAASYVDDQVYV